MRREPRGERAPAFSQKKEISPGETQPRKERGGEEKKKGEILCSPEGLAGSSSRT